MAWGTVFTDNDLSLCSVFYVAHAVMSVTDLFLMQSPPKGLKIMAI